MVVIEFEGWFQARFATDPDAFDHKRGKRGWTFAVSGEPDFDRIIRFRDPVAHRSHAPPVEVTVKRLVIDGVPAPGHALVGRPVEILGGPKFEGRNGEIAPAGTEPVFPLNIKVAADALVLEIVEWLEFSQLTMPVGDARLGQGVTAMDPVKLKSILGGVSPQAFMKARDSDVHADLLVTTDPVAHDSLSERIATFDQSPAGTSFGMLSFAVNYVFQVPPASCRLTDPQGKVPASGGNPWTVRYSMGAWDRDALQGYVTGAIEIG